MSFTLKTAPQNVQALSKDFQEVWVSTWNCAIKQKGNTEQCAFKSAWNAVNKLRGHKSGETPDVKEDKNKMEASNDKDSIDIFEEPADNTPIDNMKNGEFVIKIEGEIGFDVTPESINSQLEKADGKDVVLEVASPGGSVFDGVEIFNAIRSYEGKVEARIIGMAASMASYIPLAADKVLAEDNATYMIHNAWGFAMGDSEEMKSQAEILESINKMIAQEYVNKTGKSEKEVLDLMDNETWLFGDEMKKEGFVDAMMTHEDDSKSNKKDKNNSITEAKDKFKSILSKINKEKMKSDLDKMRNRFNNLGGKMKTSKFEEKTVDKINEIIKTLKKKAENKKPEEDIYIPVKNISLLIQDLEEISTDLTSQAEEENEESEDDSKETKTGDSDKDTKSEEGDKKEDTKSESDDEKDKDAKEKTDEDSKEDTKEDDAKESESKKGDDKKEDVAEDKDSKEEKKSEDDKEESTEEKPKDKDGKTNDKVETSKFKKLMEICDGYKVELKESTDLVSKFEKENKDLKKKIANLNGDISKFKEETKSKMVKTTLEKVSKFESLAPHEKIKLENEYSKLSESALIEIGRITDNKMFSKLEEPKPTTTPTELLNAVEEPEKTDYSKMSQSDKLEALANLNAHEKGFVR